MLSPRLKAKNSRRLDKDVGGSDLQDAVTMTRFTTAHPMVMVEKSRFHGMTIAPTTMDPVDQ
jgi:hypothetical protein